MAKKAYDIFSVKSVQSTSFFLFRLTLRGCQTVAIVVMVGKYKKKNVIKCNACSANITKSQASMRCHGGCSGWFHKACTKLSNEEYLIFSSKTYKNVWKCPKCVEASDGDGDGDEQSESDEEIQTTSSTSQQRYSIHESLNQANPSNKDILDVMTAKFSVLEKSIQFTSDILDDLQKTIKAVGQENERLRKEQNVLKGKVKGLEDQVHVLQQKIDNEELQKKSCNVVVVGLPGSPTDNLRKVFHKLRFAVQDEEYTILPLRTETQLVRFTKPELSKKLLELRKSIRVLDTKDCGIDGETRRIYINEDLPKTTRDLLKKARELKNFGYRYVWCRNGRIFARRDEGETLVKIKDLECINKLMNN